MKRIVLFTAVIFSFILFTASTTYGQAWQKNSKVLSLGFGASNFFHRIANEDGTPWGWRYPITGQLNFQGEFGIHKYVGLGFTTGLGGSAPYVGPGRGRFGGYNGYSGSINFPIGFIANFHFYQLIADNTSKNIHSDKLDIYAGANIGSGVAIVFYDWDAAGPAILAFGGVHAGARYYFAPKVGVNLELGFGKSIINGGFVFKL